jgi:hypothetical protein
MAIKIENFDNFEVAGKTYVGNFPLYSSDIVCSIPSAVDEEENNLFLTSEGDFVNFYTPTPTVTPTNTPTITPTPEWTGFLPLASTVCVGVSFTQTNTDLNGNFPDITQTAIGTKQPTWTAYSPDASTIPLGESFQQTRTNDCGETDTITSIGTKQPEFFEYSIIISANVNNYNNILPTLTNNGWNGTKKVKLTLTVNSGVTVGSTVATTAALTIPAMPTNSLVFLINNGNIYGAGGTAGLGGVGVAGGDGGNGGTALSISTPTTISNYGNIKGGGGGGGGGAGYSQTYFHCMCANAPIVCGYGCQPPGCVCGNHNNDPACAFCGQQTWPTRTYTGGNGGIGQGSANAAGVGLNETSGKLGGAGGSFGNTGSNGSAYNAILGGTGGLAGYYIKLSTGGTYVFATGLTGNVAGRIG